MRVLLALDGSPASDAARRLVASLPWPEGTVLHVVGAVEPVVDSFAALSGYPGLAADTEPAFESTLSAILDEACTSLEAAGRIVRRSVHVGRAGSVIVDEASAMRAELIVVGSRGLGPMKSMVLGSVSAEVVDHAPCPVLVVRRPQIAKILFATDGSASARGALTFLASLGCLAECPIEVISVGVRPPSLAALELGASRDAAERFSHESIVDREHVEARAASAVETLRASGRPARWSIAAG
ncbi:MAG TPA: universal stress protein, partial [Candidatus Limnocylindrales bacterium]